MTKWEFTGSNVYGRWIADWRTDGQSWEVVVHKTGRSFSTLVTKCVGGEIVLASNSRTLSSLDDAVVYVNNLLAIYGQPEVTKPKEVA